MITNWVVIVVHVKATKFIASLCVNGNVRAFPSFQLNPRKSKVSKCNSKKRNRGKGVGLIKKNSSKYYEANKDSIKKFYETNKERIKE